MRAYIPIYDNMEPYEDNDTYAEDVGFFSRESCVQWIEEQKKVLGRGSCRNERHYVQSIDIVDTPWISAKDSVVEWHLMDEASPPEGLDVLVTREYLGQNVITIDSVFDFEDGMAFWYNGDETYKAWAYLPEPYDDSDAPDRRLGDEV